MPTPKQGLVSLLSAHQARVRLRQWGEVLQQVPWWEEVTQYLGELDPGVLGLVLHPSLRMVAAVLSVVGVLLGAATLVPAAAVGSVVAMVVLRRVICHPFVAQLDKRERAAK